MTAAPHSIDPATYLDDLLAQASPDLMRQMLQGFINQILSAQADTVCGAEYGVASEQRVNHRNGYRHRDLDTRVGTIDVAVPKLRHGAFFPDWLLERRSRAERALSTVIATCYLKGVSTRRMNDSVATLGIANLSKSQVSRMSEELDEMVADFKNRPLDPGGYAYLSCDALTIKVCEGGRVVKCSVLLATGVNADGYREMLGMHVATAESNASWKGFFQDLKARGLRDVYLITSDAHEGIQHAISEVLPDASWQRCRTHFAKNLYEKVPKPQWPMVSAMFQTIFQQPDAQSTWATSPRSGRPVRTEIPACCVLPGGIPRRGVGVYRSPETGMDESLVQQPHRAVKPGDPPAHRRCGHLPEPRIHHPACRGGSCRAARRLDPAKTLHVTIRTRTHQTPHAPHRRRPW